VRYYGTGVVIVILCNGERSFAYAFELEETAELDDQSYQAVQNRYRLTTLSWNPIRGRDWRRDAGSTVNPIPSMVNIFW
jgi:hypothetical protein